MCPYYSKERKVCKIYDVLYREGEYHTDKYCLEKQYSYTECANYKECKRVNGGIAPPPSKY